MKNISLSSSQIKKQNENSESDSFINLGVVLNKDNKVLVVRRTKKEKGKGRAILNWAFPGGKQKLRETRKECVEREVLAETGYLISSLREISLRFHPQFPVVIVYHLCKLKKPKPISEPQEPWEIAEVKWVKPEELKTLFTTDIDPKVAQVLKIF